MVKNYDILFSDLVKKNRYIIVIFAFFSIQNVSFLNLYSCRAGMMLDSMVLKSRHPTSIALPTKA